LAKRYKLQVDLSPTQLAMLDELQDIGQLRTKKELLANALTLLKWAVQQKKEGRTVVSMEQSLPHVGGRIIELVVSSSRASLRT